MFKGEIHYKWPFSISFDEKMMIDHGSGGAQSSNTVPLEVSQTTTTTMTSSIINMFRLLLLLLWFWLSLLFMSIIICLAFEGSKHVFKSVDGWKTHMVNH